MAKSGRGELQRSIVFVAFSGEEEGLYGSKAYVQELVERGTANLMKGAVIMDQVGYSGPDDSQRNRAILETKKENSEVNRIIDTIASAKESRELDGYMVNYHGFGSDHISFLEKGLPAILLIERGNMFYAHEFGHTSKDRASNINPEFGARMARLATDTIWSLATSKKDP